MQSSAQNATLGARAIAIPRNMACMVVIVLPKAFHPAADGGDNRELNVALQCDMHRMATSF